MFQYIDKLLLFMILGICSISDLRFRKVKNQYVIIGIIIRPVLLVMSGNFGYEFLYNIFSSFLITLFLLLVVLCCERFFKKQLMGGADIKLIFMCGIYMTIEQLLYTLLIAFALAAIAGIVLILKKRNKVYPFVPFLAISVYSVLLPATIEANNLACQVGG